MGFYTFLTQTQQLAGGTIPGNLTVTGTLNAGSSPGGPLLETVAATPAAGVALVNGTPTILTWTAPSDSKQHRAIIFASMHVTVADTGGAVSLNYVIPDGFAVGHTLLAPSVSAGDNSAMQNTLQVVVESGSVVSVSQSTAMTVGTATVWAEIWAS